MSLRGGHAQGFPHPDQGMGTLWWVSLPWSPWPQDSLGWGDLLTIVTGFLPLSPPFRRQKRDLETSE